MDDDDFEFDMIVETIPARPARPIDFLITGLSVVAEMAQDIADGLDQVVQMSCAHANWKFEQRKFASEAGLAIEKIAEGTDG